jgi:hypothetical protein
MQDQPGMIVLVTAWPPYTDTTSVIDSTSTIAGGSTWLPGVLVAT